MTAADVNPSSRRRAAQTGHAAGLAALARATALVADGLSAEQLMPLLARCAADAARADVAAVYLQPEQPHARPTWHLAGHSGGQAAALAAIPAALGHGTGFLAPLFQDATELLDIDVLGGVSVDVGLAHLLPARSLAGVAFHSRDGRRMGVLLVAGPPGDALDSPASDSLRAIAQLLGVGIDNARLAAGQERESRMGTDTAVTLSAVLESVGLGICVIDLYGTVRQANGTLQDLFGLSPRTVGTSQEQVFALATLPPRAAEAFQARLRELNADPSQVDHSEWELASDHSRIVQRHSIPMRSRRGDVAGRVEVYTDITESRRLYTELLNSEKLRAIGVMASGVAHDFNNVLASILGQIELLHSGDLAPVTRQAISTMREAALDGASMVRNLQGLSRPRIEPPSTTANLDETVRLAVEMARPRWAVAAEHGSPIEVRLNLAGAQQRSRVAIDASELREVLLNLLFNAVDAMPAGGRIEVATLAGRVPGTAEVQVSDTGQGMPESVRARIFEPFFSTKGPKGSGLGLAVAYSIITRRGGQIEAISRVGEGTTFSIRLRTVSTSACARSAPSLAMKRRKPPGPAPLSSSLKDARILVVDDEPGLVAIERQLMERSGAVVSVATGGKPALAALSAAGARFDVVITDLDMPDVDGWAVAAAVKSSQPGAHVVMLTGWAGEIAPDDFKARGVDVLLAKPCSRAELEAAIGTLLTPSARAGLDVLLVDDEPAFARALGDLLVLQGHRVTVVHSTTAALESLASHAFDVLLTDYSLAESTGSELAERLADQPGRPFVVLVTGYATDIDDPGLLTRGIDAVLPKPCRGNDLRQVLLRVPAPVPG